MKHQWRADPLVWGHGPRIFEMFLEPTCPFSAKAFGKLDELLAQAGEDRVTVKIRLQSQPWHLFSGIIVRCIWLPQPLRAVSMPRRRSWRQWRPTERNSNLTTTAAAQT